MPLTSFWLRPLLMRRVPTTLIPPISINRAAATPIHRQIFDWYQNAIADGRLQPGERVLSSRGLSIELNVARVSVVDAYDQLLAEGYFETFRGTGTCVSNSIPHTLYGKNQTAKAKAKASCSTRRQLSNLGQGWLESSPRIWMQATGAFRVGIPALEHFPIGPWTKLLVRHSKAVTRSMLMYGDPKGYLPLRQAIAEYVRIARGVRCDTSQVIVTAGSRQALHLAAEVILNPKDRVCIEDPGYEGAVQAFRVARADIVPIGVDTDGLIVSDLERRGRGAKAVYTTPSHQYPTGATMSAARRMELLSWAARTGAWIIEDDYDSEYRFQSRPITSLQGLDSDDRVLYMGTFSKLLSPALRLGYLVLPRDLVAACEAARFGMDYASPTLNQAAMADFIREGHFARHLRRMRILYRDRCNVLVTALQSAFGSSVTIVGAEGGSHLVVELPPGIDDRLVAARAAQEGLAVMPLSFCSLRPQARGGLVLGYGCVTPQQIRAGVTKLRSCLEK